MPTYRNNSIMKKIIIALTLLAFVSVANAADLVWDYDEAADNATVGYIVYFSDGDQAYNKTFLKSETVVDGTEQKVEGIEDKLNINYGVEYTFNLVRYNDSGASDQSNSATWTREGFTPPADVLPTAPESAPTQTNNLMVR